jgi:hypothetical protein
MEVHLNAVRLSVFTATNMQSQGASHNISTFAASSWLGFQIQRRHAVTSALPNF